MDLLVVPESCQIPEQILRSAISEKTYWLMTVTCKECLQKVLMFVRVIFNSTSEMKIKSSLHELRINKGHRACKSVHFF